MAVLVITKPKSIGKRRELRKALRELPELLTGRKPGSAKIKRAFFGAMAYHLFTKISEAYEVKANYGTDELGQSWKPLTQQAMAQRPVGKGDIGRLGIGGSGENAFKERKRGLLTQSQDKLWRRIFVYQYHRALPKIGESAAKQLAAKLAWAALKNAGAQTKLATLGTRRLPILRVTDRLFNSYRPGRLSRAGYTPREEQLYRETQNSLELGSLVPYSKYQEKRRPIIPGKRKAAKWIVDAGEKALDFSKPLILEYARKKGAR